MKIVSFKIWYSISKLIVQINIIRSHCEIIIDGFYLSIMSYKLNINIIFIILKTILSFFLVMTYFFFARKMATCRKCNFASCLTYKKFVYLPLSAFEVGPGKYSSYNFWNIFVYFIWKHSTKHEKGRQRLFDQK